MERAAVQVGAGTGRWSLDALPRQRLPDAAGTSLLIWHAFQVGLLPAFNVNLL